MIVTPRNQAPLPIELRPERPARLSQTWLSNYSRCKHSAFLYTKYRGAVTSPQMERGSLAHEVWQVLTNEALDNGWPTIPHEMAKAALFDLYASGRFTVPPDEWDHVRRCVFNWAAATEAETTGTGFGGPLPLDKILGVETLVVMEIGDWTISGKLDLAWRDEITVYIRDYKTAMHPLTQEEFNHSLQQKVYSLLAAFGQPVAVSMCEDCGGIGRREVMRGAEHDEDPCPGCNGKGYIETPEPYPLGEGAQHFDIAEVYPALRFEDDGTLMQRGRTMSRTELLDERSMLEALLEQVTHSYDSGEWPALPSDDACGKCPAQRDCPLPPQLLPFDSIDTPEEAQHFAMASELLKLEKGSIDKALKAWVKNGKGKKNPNAAPRPIDLGNGTQLNFVPQEVNTTDYDGYREAVSQGKVVDLEEFRGKRIQTSFKAEPIPAREESQDEKWGETLPDTDEGPENAAGRGSDAPEPELSERQEESAA